VLTHSKQIYSYSVIHKTAKIITYCTVLTRWTTGLTAAILYILLTYCCNLTIQLMCFVLSLHGHHYTMHYGSSPSFPCGLLAQKQRHRKTRIAYQSPNSQLKRLALGQHIFPATMKQLNCLQWVLAY